MFPGIAILNSEMKDAELWVAGMQGRRVRDETAGGAVEGVGCRVFGRRICKVVLRVLSGITMA